MEKEGLKRSLALLDARGVTIDSIVTGDVKNVSTQRSILDSCSKRL